MNIALGIDPGSSGFVVALNADTREIIGSYALAFSPDGQLMTHQFSDWLVSLTRNQEGVVTRCCLESVHAIYGASAKSTFQFGRCFGSLETFLSVVGISFRLVQPKTWQKKMWEGIRPVAKSGKVDTKAMSLSAARKLFPTETFLRSVRCRVPDDNMVDATLIAYYSCL